MNIKKFRKQKREEYKSVVSVFCPILQETVYFTSDGFYHLLNESNRQFRNINEQYLKLKCLEYAPQVVSSCTKVSEIRKIKKKVKGKWKKALQYELVHEVKKGVQMRVVLERIGTGRCRFCSIMPHNRRSRLNHSH